MNLIFCKLKKLKTHESSFYEVVKFYKSLKTASKDSDLVPGSAAVLGQKAGRRLFLNIVQVEKHLSEDQ